MDNGLGTGLLQAPIQAQFTSDDGNLPSSPQATNVPQTHSASGPLGWLERNAQTIGSIALPAIADIATGGLAAPADVALAGIGGGLGQEVKNVTTGTKTNPFEEGALSAGLSAGGELLGKGFGAVAGKAGNALQQFGENYLQSQAGGLSDKLAAKIPQVFSNMSKYGINKLSDFPGFTQNVLDALDNGKLSALEDIGSKVDLSNLSSQIESTGENGMEGGILNTNSLRNTDKQTLRNIFNEEQSKLAKVGRNGSLLDVPANKAYESAAQFGSKAESALGNKAYSAASFEQQNLYNAANQIKYLIRDRIDQAASSTPLSQDIKEQVISALNDSGIKNPALNSEVLGLNTYNDLAKLESNMLDAKAVADQSAKSATKGLLSKMKTNPLSGVGVLDVGAALATHNPAVALPAAIGYGLSTDTARSTLGPVLQRAGAALASKGGEQTAENAGSNVLKGIAGNALSQTLPRSIAGAATPPTQQNTPVSSSVSNLINAAMMSNPQMAMMHNTGGTGNSSPNFASLVQSLGLQGAQQYMEYQRQTQPMISQEQQLNWTQGESVLSDLQQAAQMYEQAGAGPLKGRLSELGGVFGTKTGANAQAYNANRNTIAESILQFMNAGGSGSGAAQLTKQINQNLPTLGDSAETANTKFANLVQMITNRMQNTLAAPATNVPGALSSFAGQQPVGGSAGPYDQFGSNLLSFINQGVQ